MTVAEITETEAPPETEPLPPAACGTCGVPLDADGNADLNRLHEGVRAADLTRAMVEDRDLARRTLERWRGEVTTARRLKDAAGLVAAQRNLDEADGRVHDCEAALADRPSGGPQHGDCDGCGTPFRDGQVDRAAVEHVARERDSLTRKVRDLEHELRGAEYGVVVKQQGLAEAKAAGDKRSTAEYEEALEVATGYLGDVQAGLEDARAALNPAPDRKHHGRGK